MTRYNETRFLKMNGLGNDFVIFDTRTSPIELDPDSIRWIADREQGIGCDQLILLEKPESENGADVFMRIYNADGSEAASCGNATRCIADLILSETEKNEILIDTLSGLVRAWRGDYDTITVDMGIPQLEWDQIPLSEPFHDTRLIDFQMGPIGNPILHSPSVVSMGNPHVIFWVDDVDRFDLEQFGPMIEFHPLFPEQVNVSLAEITGADEIKVRVWERGAGITQACGTGACAVAVAAHRLAKTSRKVKIHLPGGLLDIHWDEESNHVLMTGPYTLDFKGVWSGASYSLVG